MYVAPSRDHIRIHCSPNTYFAAQCQVFGLCISQIILAVGSTYWTAAVTEAIEKGTLKDYLELCNGQIDRIVALVRGKLPSMARITLGALIVIDVHGSCVCLLGAWAWASCTYVCLGKIPGRTLLPHMQCFFGSVVLTVHYCAHPGHVVYVRVYIRTYPLFNLYHSQATCRYSVFCTSYTYVHMYDTHLLTYLRTYVRVHVY